MKRGGPLQRKTPLKQGKGLAPGKGLARGSSTLETRAPIKPRRDQPRRRNRDDALAHGLEWDEVRHIVWMRAMGRCELCGKPLSLEAMQGHHRQTRRVGPDCPGNVLALCGACHHGPEVHGGPELARELRTIVSRHEPEPCRVPVTLAGRRVTLTCGGTYA